MIKFKVLLNEINKVRDFATICGYSDCDVTVVSNKYTINGKSLLGLFSLNLSKPVEVILEGEEAEKLRDALKSYVI